ncbi:MAG: tryptophan--tRNA ligase [Actinobacteria bacterium]|nr:tryptophan--tRNA ligase [Actinomycetota bacterium]
MARVLSGIQPTGDKHIGNYIGAIRHWVVDQDVDDCFFFIVDLHALTAHPGPAELRESTLRVAAVLMACGLDPDRCTLWVQSHVHEHAELAWVLSNLAAFGELSRMTQFKDKSARQQLVGAGLFTYPVLQAADILLYRTDRVPVGEDQRQHLELTRDVAQRFNGRFGETFVLPEAAIPKVGARIMDLQDPTAKMSTSAESPQGTINIVDPPDDIRKKVRVAVTDSGREIVAREDKPAIANLLTIMSVATGRPIPDLEAAYEGKGYGDLKGDLAEAVIEYLRPIRERYEELMADPEEISRLLEVGAGKAQKVAAEVLAEVYERVGLLPRRQA